MLSWFTTNTTIELICLVIAAICLARDENLIWRSQVLYLTITCLAEISGLYISRHRYNNQWVYNIFILFEACFSYMMYGHFLQKYISSKPIIFTGLAVFLAFYVYEIKTHGFYTYSNLTYALISVQFVLFSLYFYYLLLRDEQYINLRRSANFWWVAGSLFFYFGNIACDLFDDKLSAVMITIFHQHLTYFIFKALNIILYSCWSYSFICRKWLTTTSRNLS